MGHLLKPLYWSNWYFKANLIERYSRLRRLGCLGACKTSGTIAQVKGASDFRQYYSPLNTRLGRNGDVYHCIIEHHGRLSWAEVLHCCIVECDLPRVHVMTSATLYAFSFFDFRFFFEGFGALSDSCSGSSGASAFRFSSWNASSSSLSTSSCSPSPGWPSAGATFFLDFFGEGVEL